MAAVWAGSWTHWFPDVPGMHALPSHPAAVSLGSVARLHFVGSAPATLTSKELLGLAPTITSSFDAAHDAASTHFPKSRSNWWQAGMESWWNPLVRLRTST